MRSPDHWNVRTIAAACAGVTVTPPRSRAWQMLPAMLLNHCVPSCCLIETASYNVGQASSARPVIQRILNPCFLN